MGLEPASEGLGTVEELRGGHGRWCMTLLTIELEIAFALPYALPGADR
jgi:hypothetical protein